METLRVTVQDLGRDQLCRAESNTKTGEMATPGGLTGSATGMIELFGPGKASSEKHCVDCGGFGAD